MSGSMFGEDVDREQFFEAARRQAERDFNQDPTNAQALVRWGGALLELAHYKQGDESVKMINQAITKLQKALQMDPARPEAEWCLGNAYTSMGFLCADRVKAQEQFNKAADCFRRCQAKDPNNETYKKAIEMCDKAPDYYDEIQTQLKASGMAAGSEGGKEESAGGSDFWWDVGGWVLLGVAIMGAITIARVTAAPTASS